MALEFDCATLAQSVVARLQARTSEAAARLVELTPRAARWH